MRFRPSFRAASPGRRRRTQTVFCPVRRRTGLIVEEVSRVPGIVPEEPEAGPVQRVRSALAHQVDLVGAETVFRRVVRRLFLNSWIASTERTAAGVPIDVSMLAVPSIMKLFYVGRAPMMLIALPTPCRIAPCSPPVSDRAGNGQGTAVAEIATVQWIRDLLLGNRVSNAGASRIESERVRLDFDGLAHVPGSKQHVDSLDSGRR